MSNNAVQVGHTRKVSGLATGLSSGDLTIFNKWPGVVVKDIIGTTEDFQTLEGRLVSGVKGDGKGDIAVEGVYAFWDEGGDAEDGDLVDWASASGVTKSSGAASGTVGHVWEAPFTEGGGRKVNVKLLGQPPIV